MVIWFRAGDAQLGVPDGIVRAADLEVLCSMHEAQAAFGARCTALFAAAQEQAERLLQDARTQAEQVLQDAGSEASRIAEAAQQAAQAAYDQAVEEGFSTGQQMASEQWHHRHLKQTMTRAQTMEAMQQRLSQIVTAAVERIVEAEPRQALYERAYRNVEGLCRGASALTLRVAEQDFQPARAALESLKRLRASGIAVQVEVDSSLHPGACIFESELGMLDASLDVQLQALRSAMDRAVIKAALAGAPMAEEEPAEDEEEEPLPVPARPPHQRWDHALTPPEQAQDEAYPQDCADASQERWDEDLPQGDSLATGDDERPGPFASELQQRSIDESPESGQGGDGEPESVFAETEDSQEAGFEAHATGELPIGADEDTLPVAPFAEAGHEPMYGELAAIVTDEDGVDPPEFEEVESTATAQGGDGEPEPVFDDGETGDFEEDAGFEGEEPASEAAQYAGLASADEPEFLDEAADGDVEPGPVFAEGETDEPDGTAFEDEEPVAVIVDEDHEPANGGLEAMALEGGVEEAGSKSEAARYAGPVAEAAEPACADGELPAPADAEIEPIFDGLEVAHLEVADFEAAVNGGLHGPHDEASPSFAQAEEDDAAAGLALARRGPAAFAAAGELARVPN